MQECTSKNSHFNSAGEEARLLKIPVVRLNWKAISGVGQRHVVGLIGRHHLGKGIGG